MLCIVGATATGKSALALELARARQGIEVVAVDSMQVYRGMDIGTATPTIAEQGEVPHHLISIVDPSEDYTVARYQADARAAIADIQARGGVPVLVGGTGLYLRAVVDDLEIPGQFPGVRSELEDRNTDDLHAELAEADPAAAARLEPTNRRRIIRALEVTLGSGRPFSSFGAGLESYPANEWTVVALDMPRPLIDERIERRYARQMTEGFLGEVELLQHTDGGLSRTAAQALGYKELLEHLAGRASIEDALVLAKQRTRRFARRQERWFRRDPRLVWLPVTENPGASAPEIARHYDDALRSSDRR